MKQKTYSIVSKIPFLGPTFKLLFDPLLFSSMALDNGLHKKVVAFMRDNPDVFITKAMHKKIMSERS